MYGSHFPTFASIHSSRKVCSKSLSNPKATFQYSQHNSKSEVGEESRGELGFGSGVGLGTGSGDGGLGGEGAGGWPGG